MIFKRLTCLFVYSGRVVRVGFADVIGGDKDGESVEWRHEELGVLHHCDDCCVHWRER